MDAASDDLRVRAACFTSLHALIDEYDLVRRLVRGERQQLIEGSDAHDEAFDPVIRSPNTAADRDTGERDRGCPEQGELRCPADPVRHEHVLAADVREPELAQSVERPTHGSGIAGTAGKSGAHVRHERLQMVESLRAGKGPVAQRRCRREVLLRPIRRKCVRAADTEDQRKQRVKGGSC